MKGRPRRWPFGLAAAVVALFVTSLAAAAPADDAAQKLAEAYAPVLMLRQQTDPPCNTSGEQYQPTSVDAVLGQPDVTLTREVAGGRLVDVKKAPTAADIAHLGPAYYLNLRGDPLGETCGYSRDFAARAADGRAPIVGYAHIAREPGHAGFVLQYWFYWYFNEFNDLHESDWEGMQLRFDAETPAAALAEGPSEIILFQHAGGERAGWDDSKVEKDGTHPVVYPAAGSHATFYASAIYVENGGNGAGLGCDNTSGPLREVRPRPILLPARATDQGPFAWLGFEGQWGQKEKGFNNGPTGPQTKTQWSEPFTWMADQRTHSPRMPGGSVVGPQVAEGFCGIVAFGSSMVNLEAQSRTALIVTIAVVLALFVLAVWLTRWRPVDLTRLRATRSFGQLIRAARRLYGRHWRVLVPIALTAIPIIGGTSLLAQVLSGSTAFDTGTAGSGFGLALADLVDTLAHPVASAIVAAVAIVFVRLLVDGRGGGFLASWNGMRQRFWRVVVAQLLATLGVLLLALTIIGLPWAIWKLVGWRFVQQEVLFTDKSIREAFRGSSDLVRGRWWRTVRVAVFFTVITALTGPVLAFALIFTSLPLIYTNLIGSLIFALLIPYVAIGNTLLYFDLEERGATEPALPRRSWRPWRPRQFGRRVAREGALQPAPSG